MFSAARPRSQVAPVVAIILVAAVLGIAAALVDASVGGSPHRSAVGGPSPVRTAAVTAHVATVLSASDIPDPTGPLACGSARRCVSIGLDGTAPDLLFTADGGRTWSLPRRLPLPLARRPALGGVACPDAVHCYVTGRDSAGPFVLVTADGGSSWTSASLGPATARGRARRGVAATLPPPAIACPTPARCLVDAGSTLAVTSDGGAAWRTLRRPRAVAGPGGPAEDLACPAAAACLLATAGGMLRTTDFGSSWAPVAAAPPPTAALACTAGGGCLAVVRHLASIALWTSRDAGAHWARSGAPLQAVTVPGDISLACPDAADCLLSTGTASLYLTSDAGASWTPANVLPDPARSQPVARAVACSPGRALAAVTCVVASFALAPAYSGLAATTGGRLRAAGLGHGGLGLTPGLLPPGEPPLALDCASVTTCAAGTVGGDFVASFDPQASGGGSGLHAVSLAGAAPAGAAYRYLTSPTLSGLSCSPFDCWAVVTEERLAGSSATVSAELLRLPATAQGGGAGPPGRPVTVDLPPAGAAVTGPPQCSTVRVCAAVLGAAPGHGPELLVTGDAGATWRTMRLASLKGPPPSRITRGRPPETVAGTCWSATHCLVAIGLAAPGSGPLETYETADGGAAWHRVASALDRGAVPAPPRWLGCGGSGDCWIGTGTGARLDLVTSGPHGGFRSVPVPGGTTLLAAPRCSHGLCWAPVDRRGTPGMFEWSAASPAQAIFWSTGATRGGHGAPLAAAFSAGGAGTGSGASALSCPSPSVCLAVVTTARRERIEEVTFKRAG